MADPDYSPYAPIFEGAGQQWRIDPTLLHAIARTERGIDDKGNPQTSRAGASGIMQFMPDTATEYKVDPTDPSSSIYGAAHKMSDLLQYYGGDVASALAAYNGSTWDQGQKYAKSVRDNYAAIQAEQAAAQKALEAQSPGGGLPPESPQEQAFSNQQAQQAQASPIRPKGAVRGPDYLDKSIKPGSQAETPIPPVETPPANMPSITAPPDFGKTLYGMPSTPAQPAAPTGGAADAGSGTSFTMNPQQGEQQPTKAPDFGTVLYGQPAPEPGTPTGNLQQGGGADLPTRSPYEPPTYAPTPDTWWGRNVQAPMHAMMHPSELQPKGNALLGSPLLQSTGSGLTQAARDILTTGNVVANQVDQAVPLARQADEYFGYNPGQFVKDLAPETAAYNQQYGASWPAGFGRFAGQMAGGSAFGIGRIANALTRGVETIPGIGRYVAPVLAGAFGGGAQSGLVAGGYGEDPLQATKEGAAGGALFGGTVGQVGNLFRPNAANVPRVQIANDLDIPLSRGEQAGPRSWLRAFEDTTAPLPGSGEAAKVEAQQQAIVRRLSTEMGEPEMDVIRPPDMGRIRQNIGQRINQATSQIDVPSSPQFMRDMADAENAARQSGPDSPQWHNFVAIRDQLLNQMANNGGSLPGPQFQRFLSQGGTLDNALNSSNLDVQQAARNVRDAMFDAAGNNAAMPPSALRDLQTARYQWKVEEAVRDSMERAASGSEAMSFPRLAGALQRGRFYPGSPMSNLSQLLYDIPSIASSGTAERTLRQRLLGLGGLGATDAGGAGLLWALNNPHSFDQMLANVAAPIAGNVVGARASRFGPGLGLNIFGYNPLAAAQQNWNPLGPRYFGGTWGNSLMQPQPQPAQ